MAVGNISVGVGSRLRVNVTNSGNARWNSGAPHIGSNGTAITSPQSLMRRHYNSVPHGNNNQLLLNENDWVTHLNQFSPSPKPPLYPIYFNRLSFVDEDTGEKRVMNLTMVQRLHISHLLTDIGTDTVVENQFDHMFGDDGMMFKSVLLNKLRSIGYMRYAYVASPKQGYHLAIDFYDEYIKPGDVLDVSERIANGLEVLGEEDEFDKYGFNVIFKNEFGESESIYLDDIDRSDFLDALFDHLLNDLNYIQKNSPNNRAPYYILNTFKIPDSSNAYTLSDDFLSQHIRRDKITQFSELISTLLLELADEGEIFPDHLDNDFIGLLADKESLFKNFSPGEDFDDFDDFLYEATVDRDYNLHVNENSFVVQLIEELKALGYIQLSTEAFVYKVTKIPLMDPPFNGHDIFNALKQAELFNFDGQTYVIKSPTTIKDDVKKALSKDFGEALAERVANDLHNRHQLPPNLPIEISSPVSSSSSASSNALHYRRLTIMLLAASIIGFFPNFR